MNYKKLLETYRKRRATAKRLVASGMKVTEVARALGITRQRVYQIIK